MAAKAGWQMVAGHPQSGGWFHGGVAQGRGGNELVRASPKEGKLSGKKKIAQPSLIGQVAEASSRDPDNPVLLFRFFIEMRMKLSKYGINSAKRNIRRPVRKRTVCRVVREAATTLVRRRSQHMWVGYDQRVAMQETRGSGRDCSNIFSVRVPLSNPTAADKQPRPKHNF